MMEDEQEFVPLADRIKKRKREAIARDEMTAAEKMEAEYIEGALGLRADMRQKLALRRKKTAVHGRRLFNWMRDNKLNFRVEGNTLTVWIDEGEGSAPPAKRAKIASILATCRGNPFIPLAPKWTSGIVCRTATSSPPTSPMD